ncbi:unnamed protein product [Orchesella dallaii]|uniref:Uncharacterized protein n=1 Tax=Orchesella dallaii TaxID=48710 RepID=A0ABP1S8U1_9HEXA
MIKSFLVGLYSFSSVPNTLIVLIIVFGSSISLGQAQNSPDCINYSINATTGRLECTEKIYIDVDDSNVSSDNSNDIGPIKTFVLVVNILAWMCFVIRCYTSLRRDDAEVNSSAVPEEMSTPPPEVIVDPELPQYEPPPSYNEYVINVNNSDIRKL